MKDMRKLVLPLVVWTLWATASVPASLPGSGDFAPGTVNIVSVAGRDGTVETKVVATPESPAQQAARISCESKADANATLSVTVIADKNGKNAAAILVIKDIDVSWQKMIAKGTSKFKVPLGKYLVVAVFKDNNTYVFLPDVNVAADTTVTVCYDMATRKAVCRPVLPSGDPVVLEGSDGDTPYNANSVWGYQQAFYKGLSKVCFVMIDTGGTGYPGNLCLNTNLSDSDGAYLWSGVCQYSGGAFGYNIAKLATDVRDGDLYQNNVNDFVELTARFEPFLANPGNNVNWSIDYNTYSPGGLRAHRQSMEFHHTTRVFICDPLNNPEGFGAGAMLANWNMGNPTRPGALTPEMTRTAEGIVCRPSQRDGVNYAYSTPSLRPCYFNPHLAYAWNRDRVMGHSAPYCVTKTVHNTDGNPRYYTYDVSAYYGNLGEGLPIDTTLTQVSIDYDDKTENFADYHAYCEWAKTRVADGHARSRMKVRLDNANFKFGQVDGKSTCEIDFDEAGADCEPPTIQRIMMRTADGAPAISFDTSADGRIDLCGGDFEFNYKVVNNGFANVAQAYYAYKPATLTLEYAPRGSENFKALAPAEDASKFVPGFGAWWSAPLSAVDAESPDGWFDLRIKLADEAGNTQTQLLSPAFYIKSLDASGVEALDADDNDVYVDNGRVVCASGTQVRVYSLDGVERANRYLAGASTSPCAAVKPSR